MQNKWNEEESKLTFKPEIPAESLHLLSRRLTDPADSGTSSGQRVVQDTHDRLHNTTITCKSEVLLITQNTPNKLSDPAEHDKFIDRLTYEYEIKAKRQEELKKLFLETDIKTGKPLFKPTIPGSSLTHVLHLSEEESAWTDATTNGAEARKEKIHEKLLRRGEEHRERMQILQEHFLAKEKEEMEAQSRHALPESTRILQESSENSIGEIFKVLLTCQMHNEAKNSPETSDALKRAKGLDPEVLLKISMELSNWREGVLNIAEADPELMIESVQSLLTEVIELSKSKNCNSKYPNVYRQYDKPVLLDLELFSEHIWSCIKKREGGGKSYLFLPRREVSPKKEEKPPPFRPEIDEKSRKMVLSSRNNAVPVEDILLNRYEESQLRFEDIKRDIDKERYAECTFQPHFYKPGNGIKPRPKYQSSVQEISSKIQPPEPSRIIANSDSKTQQSKKRGIIVSVTRVATGNNSVGKGKASVESWEDAEAGVKQLYDIDNESLENSNDSITVPRQSIMSAVSLESSPNASSDQILSSMRERHSNSSGGVSIYSPPWIKKT